MRSVSTVVVLFCTVIALSTLAAGIDYFADCLGIDALIRGDLDMFFAMQPMQGSASLLLRAPFVALVYDENIDIVYYMGLLPCYAALLALGLVFWRRTEGRPLADRLLIVMLCAGSPFVVKAVHWGHPEDLLATALTIGAFLLATRGRPVLAGVLLGTAYASKQWAVVAGLPILLALPRGHWRFFLTSCGVALLFVVPMAIGDWDRFWLVTRDAGSAVPGLRAEGATMPGVRVLPQSVWHPISSPDPYGGFGYRFATPLLSSTAHPLLVIVGIPLAGILWRRHRRLEPLAAARLLALVLLLRCALDPNNLDYYHVPVVSSLALLAVLGGRRELHVALLATAGMAVAFVQPAMQIATVASSPWLKWAVYMAAVLPLGYWLARDLYFADRRLAFAQAPRTLAVGR